MKPAKVSLLLASAVLFGLSFTSALAQGFGTVVGTVSDSSGSVIPGAKITVTEEGTQASRSVVANEQGYFVVNIPSRGTIAISSSFAVARSAAVAAILSSRARGFGRARGVVFGTGVFHLDCVADLHDRTPVIFGVSRAHRAGFGTLRGRRKRLAWGNIPTVQKRGRCWPPRAGLTGEVGLLRPGRRSGSGPRRVPARRRGSSRDGASARF